MIANLLINGREAMPDGGNLSIEARLNAATVEVAVVDEGTGIPADVLQKMFAPFFTTKALGTGLGLSMARDVVTRLGGRDSCRESLAAGSRYHFEFSNCGIVTHQPSTFYMLHTRAGESWRHRSIR